MEHNVMIRSAREGDEKFLARMLGMTEDQVDDLFDTDFDEDGGWQRVESAGVVELHTRKGVARVGAITMSAHFHPGMQRLRGVVLNQMGIRPEVPRPDELAVCVLKSFSKSPQAIDAGVITCKAVRGGSLERDLQVAGWSLFREDAGFTYWRMAGDYTGMDSSGSDDEDDWQKRE